MGSLANKHSCALTYTRPLHRTDTEAIVEFLDVIYGTISMSPLDMQFIDQRLDELRQLGITYKVYKSAHHTRKDHSIGVAHITETWMNFLATSQPELQISARLVSLVKLGGLLHDVGHTAFSHTFDDYIAPLLGLDCARSDHECRSAAVLRFIAREARVDLAPADVDFVAAVISGRPVDGHPAYLFEIVANQTSSLDADKMDYLQRDAYFCGLKACFQPFRIMRNSRVIDGHLCFREKVYMDIFQLFQTRFHFHREIYHHPTVMVLVEMLIDALSLALPHLKPPLRARFDTDDPYKWAYVTDHSIMHEIRVHPSAALDAARRILDAMDRRQLYTHKVSTTEATKVREVVPQHPVPSAPALETPLRERTVRAVIGYTGSGENPMPKIWFFDKDNPSTKFRMRAEDVSFCLPIRFSDVREITLSQPPT
jgi:HD superfamily phosphohydrolase